MPDHFSFTKLVVDDLDGAAAFYTAVFGFTEQVRVESSVAGRPIREILYEPTAPGGSSFALFRFEDHREPRHEELILGFLTDDVDALVERALANGGSVVDPPHDMPEHGVRVTFLADPEGHLLEVVALL